MWIKAIWHWICILVFFSGLIDLLLSRNKVFYESGFTSLSDTFGISVCLEIDSNLYDCSSLEHGNLSVCEALKGHFQYVEDGESKSPQDIIERFNHTTNGLSLFEFNDECNITQQYQYLNLNHLCTLYKVHIDQDAIEKLNFFQFDFFNKFHLTLKLFLFPEGVSRYLRYEYLNCDNFQSCLYFNLSVTEYKRNTSALLPSGSEADCFDYSSKSFYFKLFESIASESQCLQECLKFKKRFSKFFYTKNDHHPIEFNRSEHFELLDSTLTGHVRHCKYQCSKPSCSIKYFHFRGLIYNSTQNYVRFKIDRYQFLFEAKPYIGTLDFTRKSLGFIGLFFKVSISSLVLKANKFFRSKIQHDNSSRKSILSIALAIFWLGLVSSFFYGSDLARLIYDQHNLNVLTPYIYYDIPLVPSNFSIALCDDVLGKTKVPLHQLEKPANRFNTTDKFIVKFGCTERKLIFLNDKFFYRSFKGGRLEHCFSTDVYIKEAR